MYQKLLSTTQTQALLGGGSVQKSYKYRSSTFYTIIRRIKYLIFFILFFIWITGFTGVGILILNIHTIISKKTAYKFIAVGLIPIMFLLLYLCIRIIQRYLTNRPIDWSIFKYN